MTTRATSWAGSSTRERKARRAAQHNYNVVPTDKGRILVSNSYQSGISVLDFTDPANVKEIAFADPAPLLNPDNPAAIEGGGDWSSYWYDGRIYESDMTRGLDLEPERLRGRRRQEARAPEPANAGRPRSISACAASRELRRVDLHRRETAEVDPPSRHG